MGKAKRKSRAGVCQRIPLCLSAVCGVGQRQEHPSVSTAGEEGTAALLSLHGCNSTCTTKSRQDKTAEKLHQGRRDERESLARLQRADHKVRRRVFAPITAHLTCK